MSIVISSSLNKAFSRFSPLIIGLLCVFGLSGCPFDSNDSKDSSEPTVTLADASTEEGNAGNTDLVFTITASKASDSAISVTYSTSDGTASAGSDYTGITNHNVEIPAGDTSVTITVSINGDNDIEADETFTLTLTATSGATLGTASATGTIVNDDEDPKGFYDSGTGTVKESNNTTDRSISDLQGMVSGDRFILMSVSEVLLYDGTFISRSGNSYTATVNIYEDGVLLADSVAASGSITTASSLTVILTGAGAGNGNFALTYSLNNADSALTRISLIDGWRGPLNGASTEIRTTFISNSGGLSRTGTYLSDSPVIAGCDIGSGSVLPISGENIYLVTLTLITCTDAAVDGGYSGFATTQSILDDVLLFTYSNGSFSASGLLFPG